MKPLIRPPNGHAGFTLLEALIALLVVATGVLALVRYHGAALFGSADAKARSQAVELGQSKMDELRTYFSEVKFNALSNSSAAETASSAGTDLAVTGMDWVNDYLRTWTVSGIYLDSSYKCGRVVDGNYTVVDCAAPPCPCPDVGTSACSTYYENCHAKLIRTSVTWTDAKGVEQSIKLESFIEGVEPTWSGLALSGTIPTTAGP